MNNLDVLQSGIEKLELQIDKNACQQLLLYLQLLADWNNTHNLTAIRNIEDMVSYHLLDSLSALPYVNGIVADIGSGGGLPGIVLAIANPKLKIYLVETKAKKCFFLEQVVAKLKLTNVNVVNSRVESYKPDFKFDIIISRAFAKPSKLISFAEHLLKADGSFLAMTGLLDKSEIVSINDKYKIIFDRKVLIPNLPSEHHLVELKRNI